MTNLTFNAPSVNFSADCSSKYDCTIYEYLIQPGKYLFELWGGQGGKPDNIDCCHGGYIAANVTIKKTRKIFIYIGVSGLFGNENYSSTFNGGGANYVGNLLLKSGTGGSASDVRWSHNLHDRFLVAGAGGGSCYGYNNAFYEGGQAGGLIGLNGSGYTGGFADGGMGGSQDGPSDRFGIGSNASGVAYSSGGGGSGYYGGQGPYESGGGGGSSFIDSFYPGIIKSGRDLITEPSGITRIGHTGDGYMRITAYLEQIFKPFSCKVNSIYFMNYFIIHVFVLITSEF